nr:glutaredoxin [Rhizobium sp. BK060]
MASRPAVIYSRSSCQYCKAAKELLNALKIDYQEIDIVETEGADDQMVVVSGGRRTTPQIFIAGSHIGGADDLQALADSGKLAGILGTG